MTETCPHCGADATAVPSEWLCGSFEFVGAEEGAAAVVKQSDKCRIHELEVEIVYLKRQIELAVPPKPFMGPRSPKWKAVRDEHIKRHPSCAACGRKEALECHHIKPFHLHPELELDAGNLITLCESPGRCCHYLFGHLLDWNSWNSNVSRDAAMILYKVQTRPGNNTG